MLRVGILGSGNAAAKHRAAYAELPEIFTVTDVEDCDVVDICTPSAQHYADIRDHWAKPVIVEKPVCGSLAEIDSLLLRPAPIIPVFQYRFVGADWNKSIVLHWKRDDAYFSGWRGKWDTALGGCLTTHGIHAIDLILLRYGALKRVTCVTDTITYAIEVEDTAAAIFEFASGHLATLNVTIDRDGGRSTYLGDSHGGYVEQFERIHAALANGHHLPVTLADARAALEALTACYLSADTGFTVTLPIRHDHPAYQGLSAPLSRPLHRSALSPRISELSSRR